MIVNKGLTSVLARMKCAVVTNTDINLTVESRTIIKDIDGETMAKIITDVSVKLQR